MDLQLSGRTALVCGSTQGLGLACAKELAFLGANVVLMARNEDKLKEVCRELPTGNGRQHEYLVADFSNPATVENAIIQYTLNKPVHILVNNTGGPAGGPALSAQPYQYIDAFNAHLICNQLLVQAVVPGMKEAGFGRIINIISTSVKQPISGLGVSNTIRAAVANWAKTLAGELGKFGITVNNVLPGLTRTVRAEYILSKKSADTGKTEQEVEAEMLKEIPVGRMGNPEELGAAVAFLASPAAAYINGINLPVDGGRTSSL